MNPEIKSKLGVEVMRSDTSPEEILALSLLSGPDDEQHYRKIMLGFIANSVSSSPDLDKGIVYCLYKENELIASTRIKQDEYTSSAASIEYFAVQPQYQGQGFGKFFLESLFNKISEVWKKKFVMLATGESRAFYEKSGMKLLGKIENASGSERFYMYKELY